MHEATHGTGGTARPGSVPLDLLPRATSTQDVARDLLRGGRTAPFAVATTDQTGGRGRLGRAWSCAPGRGLALTLVHRSPLAATARSWCTLAAGLAALEAIEAKLERLAPGSVQKAGLGLKWPNDIHDRHGRKLAGILTEAGPGGHLLIGIGFNLAGPVIGPDGVEMAGACALTDCADIEVSAALDAVSALAADVSAATHRELAALDAAGGDAVVRGLAARYRERCVTTARAVRVASATGGSAITGEAVGIDDAGRLRVALADGSVRPIDVGDVEHVRGAIGRDPSAAAQSAQD